MIETKTQEDLSLESLVAEVVDEFRRRQQAGERPDIEEYAARHPQAAATLRQVLASLNLLEQAAASEQVPESPALGELGDFRIVREVGRGGMGVVYEAEQISLGRHVALKVLPFAATMDSRQLQRFHNEARAAACLQHPNIVPVHAVGCTRGVHYYAMQYINGLSLEAMIASIRPRSSDPEGGAADRKALQSDAAPSASETLLQPRGNGKSAGLHQRQTVNQACGKASTLLSQRQSRGHYRCIAELARQAAEALDYSHQSGVIHRDIKPGNLLVDDEGKLWVTDFGLAQVQTDNKMTLTGDLIGTLRYMSPEQALAKRVIIDHRTDIYSLGATFYEMLTLQPAFSGQDRQELLRQIAFEEPRPPRKLDKQVPFEVETIVLKCLEKNPQDRYGSAKELADDLKRYLNNEPLRAKRAGLGQKAVKWVRRHPAAIWAAAIALVALSIGLAGTTWGFVRAEQKHQDAVAAAESEKKAKEEAETKSVELQAVLDFVQKRILAAARPAGQAGGLGHDVTLRSALEAALPFLNESFKDQPLIEARLRMTVGGSFKYLGEPKTASLQFERALEVFGKLLGPDHRETLASMNNLANSYTELGRHDDVVKLREETLKLKKTTLGPDHPDTLTGMHNLAISHALLGRHAEALKLLEETLVLRRKKLGPDHRETLQSMNNLANSYAALGRHPEALKLREETLAVFRIKLGPDHPTTLQSMHNLAISHAHWGRHDEALKLFEETLALKRMKLGPDHPETLFTMNDLASTLRLFGKLDEAVAKYWECHRLCIAKLGETHSTTLSSMDGLGLSLVLSGKPNDAAQLLRDCLALRQKTEPKGWRQFDTMSVLGGCLLAQKKHAEAEPLLLKGYEGMKAQETKIGFSEDRLGFTDAIERLIQLYREMGDAEAEARWRKELEASKAKTQQGGSID